MGGDIVIRMEDVLAAGYCARGVRRWFNDHAIDFRKFMRSGIPASDLLATGCPQAERVVSSAVRRRNG